MSAPLNSGLESFAHIEAKRLLLTWLREAAATAGRDEYACLGLRQAEDDKDGIDWRVNRSGPHWGVWPEYPVLADGTGIERVWDEISERWNARPPTYDEVIRSGNRPMAVLDIAIQHKGQVVYAIEVVHKHRCDPRKIGFLRPRLTLLEIPAYWALGQVGTPTAIPAEFFL